MVTKLTIKLLKYIRVYITMPIKYTFEQVKNTFIQNNCILLDNEYINQLQKINYIASCGHTNITMFTPFLISNAHF